MYHGRSHGEWPSFTLQRIILCLSSENRTKCGRSKLSKTERSYTMSEKMLLTVQETADLTGLCAITIYELAKTHTCQKLR